MPPADACKDEKFLEGLEAMHRLAPDLVWEFANQPIAIQHVTEVIKKFPQMNFVLDHLGHVWGAGYNFETWKQEMINLATLPNVVAKLGDIEEWEVSDPQPYLQHALKTFGYDR